ncbi:MAG: hypothetical protein IPH13_17025 [Planctomycetes bacterium]|nr:hypothetical protein [Planctomycetota bacterium]
MRFRFFDPALSSTPMISVDGLAPLGPNFSHWPGNRTPPALRHDLSTGIVLRWAKLSPAERARSLDGLDVVTNNHVDTDGILSVFTMLHPEHALEHAPLLLEAAGCGDFQTFTTAAGLAIELTLTALLDSPQVQDLEGVAKRQMQYELALELVPTLLTDPFARRDLIAAEFDRIRADVDTARSDAVRIHSIAALDLAVIDAPRELDRVAFNTAAGDHSRVLTLVPHGRGHLVRCWQRVESWFDLASRVVLPRVDLRTLATRLEALEAPEAEAHWHAHPADEPVPECWFGEIGDGPSFGPTVSGALSVSRLARRLIVRAVEEQYESASTRTR